MFHLKKKMRIRAIAGVLFFTNVIMLTGCSYGTYDNSYVNRNRNQLQSEAVSVASVHQIENYSKNMAILSSDFANSFSLQSDAGELLLVNDDKNEILYSSNSMKQVAMASTTKLMTAYIVLSRCKLDEVVTVKNDIALESGAVVLYLQKGDSITVDELLHGLLIESANDCAVVLAEYVSGSVSAFAKLMNETAKELGATHSHFENPHGLDEKGHYSCAYDLYLIFKKDLENDHFREIIGTKKYKVQYNREGETIETEISNTNLYFNKTYETPAGLTIVGGKTGTTSDAGHCLVLSAQNKAGEHLIGIVLNATEKNNLYDAMSHLLTQNK